MEPGTQSFGSGSSLSAGAAEPTAVHSWRLVGGMLALASFLAGIFAILSPWWTIIGAGNSSFSFYLTDTLRLLSFSTVGQYTLTYDSLGMGCIQFLYACLLALVLVSLILALIAGTLGVLSAVGRVRQTYWTRAVRTFLVVALVLALAATIAGPAAQPTAFSREQGADLNFCLANPGGDTPCATFWGSINASGIRDTWGPSLGWYLVLTSSVLLFAALLCGWRGRPRPGNPTPPTPTPVAPSAPTAATGGENPPASSAPVEGPARALRA